MLDVPLFVDRRYGKSEEQLPRPTRGERLFKVNRSGETVAVHFSRAYRRLGIRVDVHRADPTLPLIDADHHVFVCIDSPDEVVLISTRKELEKMMKDGELRKDATAGKHYVVLKDVELI